MRIHVLQISTVVVIDNKGRPALSWAITSVDSLWDIINHPFLIRIIKDRTQVEVHESLWIRTQNSISRPWRVNTSLNWHCMFSLASAWSLPCLMRIWGCTIHGHTNLLQKGNWNSKSVKFLGTHREQVAKILSWAYFYYSYEVIGSSVSFKLLYNLSYMLYSRTVHFLGSQSWIEESWGRGGGKEEMSWWLNVKAVSKVNEKGHVPFPVC